MQQTILNLENFSASPSSRLDEIIRTLRNACDREIIVFTAHGKKVTITKHAPDKVWYQFASNHRYHEHDWRGEQSVAAVVMDDFRELL